MPMLFWKNHLKIYQKKEISMMITVDDYGWKISKFRPADTEKSK